MSFAFYGTTLQRHAASSGRATSSAQYAVNGALGDAVGKLYVAKYFPASSKAAISEMVNNIKAAFDKRIEALAWMTPATKEEAPSQGRHDARRRRLSGQVERLLRRSRSGRTTPMAISQRAERCEYQHQLAKLGQAARQAANGGWSRRPSTRSTCRCRTRSISRPASSQPPFYRSGRGRGRQLRRDRRGDRP